MSEQVKLELEIDKLKSIVGKSNLRSDMIRLNCLISKYERLYGKDKDNAFFELTLEEIEKYKQEFDALNKYKKTSEYLSYVASYKEYIKKNPSTESNVGYRDPSKTVYVRPHYRRPKSY